MLRISIDGTGGVRSIAAITDQIPQGTPRPLAVTPWGELLLSECCGVNRIVRYRFDSSGQAVFNGLITGGMDNPPDIAFSPWGELFVTNPGNNTVSRYLFDAEHRASFNGSFSSPLFQE